jgi:hypothetical protein
MWRDEQAICCNCRAPAAGDPEAPADVRLRAKAKLADASDERAVLGLVGPATANALAEWFPVLPAAPTARSTTATAP